VVRLYKERRNDYKETRILSIAQADFESRLRSAMQARGWTQQVLAERTGLTQQLISRWLTGGWPHTRYLPRLALALGCSIDWLLTGQDSLSQPAPADRRPVDGLVDDVAARTVPAAKSRRRRTAE